MSTTYSAPSGPVRAMLGRNQLSALAMNSLPVSSGWRWLVIGSLV